MFPLKDENSTKSFPFFTILFILLNITVFIFQVLSANESDQITTKFALIPVNFLSYQPEIFSKATYLSVNPYATLITHTFLHGGILHLAFNMLFLWIFGNNIEDYLGKIKFVVFYILCGISAALLHIFMNADSKIPMVGASGAIAGILGAYIVLYPRARIHTLFIFFFILKVIRVPAVIFIGFWFLVQILSATNGGADNTVAWYAHIGGFVAGIALLFILGQKKKKRKIKAV